MADEVVSGEDAVIDVVEQPEAVTQTANAAAAAEPARAEIESKTAAAMAKVFANSSDDETDVAPIVKKGPPVKPPAARVAPAAAAKEEPAGDEAGATEEEAGEVAAPGDEPAANPTGVPAAHRRSLKAFQWTDAEIDAAHKANPVGFALIATKLHDSRNETTRQMSELGRQLKTQQQPAAAAPGGEPAKPAKAAPFKKLDVAALKAKYGDEDFITELEALNGVVDFANDSREWITASKQRQAEVELEALGKQIDGYFTGTDLKDFSDLYGKAGTDLKPEQISARQKVIETADLLIAGARQMGRAITLDEALTMAHDSVSAPSRAAVATKKLATQVQARQASISVRPSGRSVSATPSAAGDRKKLEGNVLAGLGKAFSP